MKHSYIALVPRPLEAVCAREIAEISGVSNVVPLTGAVAFTGDLATLYRVNLWSACSMRVLQVLVDAPCQNANELYDLAWNVPWEQCVSARHTFAIRAHGQTPALKNTVFVSQRVKDALVDRLRDRINARPDVHATDPDVPIVVHLYAQNGEFRCRIALDSSGIPLSYRGYRFQNSAAPLKEALAAALLRVAGYHEMPLGTPLVDPFCGSGTFLIEAGMLTQRKAPGLHRSFAFQRWPHFDTSLWRKLHEDAVATPEVAFGKPFLFGSDHDPRMAKQTAQHANHLGLHIQTQTQDIQDVFPPSSAKGLVICNPPYGHRLGDESQLIDLYRTLGNVLKRRFAGWKAYILTGNLPLGRQIGLSPSARHVVYNGPIESRFLQFDLYSQSSKSNDIPLI